VTGPKCSTCRDSGAIYYGCPASSEPCDNCPRGAMRAAERYVGGTVTFLPRAASAWCLTRAKVARRAATSTRSGLALRPGTRTMRRPWRDGPEVRRWVAAARAFRLGEFNGPATVAVLP
jgi:hypothetical protein